MQLSFNWINLLILFGALQGLIFGIILLFNRQHPGARYLALFLFVLSYNGFETFNWSSGLDRYWIFFDLFSYILIYAIGPSLYLYVRAVTRPGELPIRHTRRHYLPVMIQFVTRCFIIVYHLLWINKLINTRLDSGLLAGWYDYYAEPLSALWYLAYLLPAIRLFRGRNSEVLSRTYSKESRKALDNWLKNLLTGCVLVGIAWPITLIVPYFFNIPGSHYYPIELGLVLFIYWLAMSGYYFTRQITPKPARALPGPYAMPNEQMQKLKEAMEMARLYLDPELNVSKLAGHTGISARTISALLNQYQHTNFNDFVNKYRIREVKERLGDPAHNYLTISGIALSSGFNSQATFQRVFKGVTGTTPSKYLSEKGKVALKS
ncbi:helix-turn-helix domain-containing protein [Hufsiella ginkgonis]|uniref:Helix-turn-helix domain-containing protein n=1 Tax=Hufsiella ginkgonis TaxID=2695274 RepID=A0A7K1XVF9_9SPHI|nr:helix-turn-helix domain-containing protein [Hufsiella ginkgonis]MXV14788.1 helix-turn-helix domain-containing protein [Hufsiella ginkgonis]